MWLLLSPFSVKIIQLFLQVHTDAATKEVAELKKMFQDEIRQRKAAEEEIHNLKDQLLKFSKGEVWFKSKLILTRG